jgi:hypothetical protein
MKSSLESKPLSAPGPEAKPRWAPLEPADARWRHLVQQASGASLYHSERWLTLLARAYRLKLWLFTLERDERPVAGVVFARSKNPLRRRFVALPFSDYCPPLSVEAGAEAELLLQASAAPQRATASWEVRGAAPPAPWDVVRCFASWRLELEGPFAELGKGVAGNFRRDARRAEREGTTVVRAGSRRELARFYTLHLATRRRLGLPAQPWRFFEELHRIFAPAGALETWLARQRGEDVAGAVFLRDRADVYYKWSARAARCPKGASHLILLSALAEFAGRPGRLDLGRTDTRNQGLARFKNHLGAVAVPLPYAYLPGRPGSVSAENPGAAGRLLTALWRRLPAAATRLLGGAIYPYLA